MVKGCARRRVRQVVAHATARARACAACSSAHTAVRGAVAQARAGASIAPTAIRWHLQLLLMKPPLHMFTHQFAHQWPLVNQPSRGKRLAEALLRATAYAAVFFSLVNALAASNRRRLAGPLNPHPQRPAWRLLRHALHLCRSSVLWHQILSSAVGSIVNAWSATLPR
jgi:hypothetical protein